MGASTELVKMFDQLGIVASLDTQDCIATAVVTRRINKVIHSELTPHTLTVVSRVYWHSAQWHLFEQLLLDL